MPKVDEELILEAVAEIDRLNKRYKDIREKAVRYGPVKGFVVLKCENCGKQKIFNVKSQISDLSCECGHHTYLKGIRNVFAKCKCGESHRYSTNAADEYLTLNCIKCGAPIDTEMALNGDYLTILEGEDDE